jgi:hypothetical protein
MGEWEKRRSCPVCSHLHRFLAATSNQLFLSLPAEQAHVVVREDGTLDVRPGHEKTAQLTAPDRRFVDAVLDTVRKAEDGQFLGSDGWVREQFREYLAVRVPFFSFVFSHVSFRGCCPDVAMWRMCLMRIRR